LRGFSVSSPNYVIMLLVRVDLRVVPLG